MSRKAQPRNEEAPSAGTLRASNVDQLIRKGDVMNTSTITAENSNYDTQLPVIAGHEIAIDEHGRFNLGSLQKAHLAQNPGLNRSSKQPSDWVKLAQTKELVAELSNSEDLPSKGVEPIVSKMGRYGGTFAHELLAVSYAGWISPKFQLQVNQVFLDYRMGRLQRAEQEVEQQKALPNPLSPEHQRGIQKAVARRVQALPKGIQKLAYARIYGHLKDRFGVAKYDQIEDSRYTEALGAIQSYELEGDFLAADPVPDLERLDIDYPLSSWPEINRNIGQDFINRQRTGDYLVAPYHLFGESNHSPTRMVLATLERAGYRVDACKHELLALQIYLEGIIGRLAEIRNIAEGPRAFHRVRYMV